MNQAIKNWTSLSNLKKANIAGQMATFLILIITVMLIFVLSLVNVGQVSNNATNLANASDSASLFLASQLGTKAYQLSVSLYNSCKNGKKCCKSMGFLGMLLAIVVAIVVTVITWNPGAGFWAAAGTVAIVAGSAAVAGGIGGAIDGSGFLQGAIQGAMIGASIAGGAYMGGSMFGTTGTTQAGAAAGTANAGSAGISAGASTAGSGGATVTGGVASGNNLAVLVAPGQVIPSWATTLASGSIATVVPSFGGAMAGVGLASGLAVANGFIQMEMQADAMSAAAKAINGLPEKKRYRESTFLRAFSDTIDDPNKVADETDIDGDGDTTEKMPVFQVLWDRRVQEIKAATNPAINQAQDIIDNFFDSKVSNFQAELDNFKADLARMEVEGSDGIVTELLRGLEIGDGIPPQYPVSFWDPGPDKAALGPPVEADGGDDDCDECDPPLDSLPPGYDELDSAIGYLQYVSDELKTLKDGADANTWNQWGHFFYDVEPDGADDDLDLEDGEDVLADDTTGETGWSLYDALGSLLNGEPSVNPPQIGLRAWNNEVESIRLRLSACTYDPANPEGSPTNSPCLGHPTIPDFATIDTDLDNEFIPVQEAIAQFIATAEQFRRDAKEFYEVVSQLMPEEEPEAPPAATGYGLSGDNPAAYRWQDSRGDHSITVEIYKFKVPKIKKKKSFFKVCLKLKRFKQKVKLRITRADPSGATVGMGGILGIWNPSGGTISRTSVAKYRAVKYKTEEKEARKNYVKIVRTTWNK